jgi:branched-chain amino acid transport system permease protein
MSSIGNLFKNGGVQLSPIGLCVFFVLGMIPVLSDNLLICEILIAAYLYAIFAMSWDILSGYTRDVNFGHAFFIGGGGYVAGLLNLHFGLPILVTVLLGGVLAGVFGIIIGSLTLRLKGPYFALATFAVSAVAYKLSIIWSDFTGGEEGLSGISTITAFPRINYYTVLGLTAVCFLFLEFFGNSKYGIILRSIGTNEEAAEASGINTSYYKVLAFTLSGFVAGIGGGIYAQWQMQMDPTMLGVGVSGSVILLAVAGGMGTVIGPMLAAITLQFFNEWLRIFSEYRVIIYTGILILAIYIAPDGFVNQSIIKEHRFLKRFILGEVRRHGRFKDSKG